MEREKIKRERDKGGDSRSRDDEVAGWIGSAGTGGSRCGTDTTVQHGVEEGNAE